jgi:tRNA(Ile)-lysidine synthase
LQQPWREDASNQDMAHTRNRIRWQLLPLLRTFNPQIAAQLARLASISADEEAYWQGELRRLLPLCCCLAGPPGAAAARPAPIRRKKPWGSSRRACASCIQPSPGGFCARRAPPGGPAQLRAHGTAAGDGGAGCGEGIPAPGKFELPGGITVERSLREIRLTRRRAPAPPIPGPAYPFLIPGEIRAPEYGCVCAASARRRRLGLRNPPNLRPWKAGDRVTLRHSRGPKKVAEVLDRLHVVGAARKNWPVVESEGKIVWMRGVEVDAPEFIFTVQSPAR